MLVCVNYHYIRENFETKNQSIFGITPKNFEKQLDIFSRLGSFISPNQLSEHIINKSPLKGLNFLITFDDGLKEQYEYALPILEKLGIPAIFFANSWNSQFKKVSRVHKIHLIRSKINSKELFEKALNLIGDKNHIKKSDLFKKAQSHYKYDNVETASLKYLLNFVMDETNLSSLVDNAFSDIFSETSVNTSLYMGKEQLIDLANKDMLGSHGHSHIPIGMQNKTIKINEIVGSQEYFYQLTGKKLKGFSFPYGNLESLSGCKQLLQISNFSYALSMERAINDNLDQPFALSRFDNNDMPGGKSYRFNSFNELTKYPKRSWFVKN